MALYHIRTLNWSNQTSLVSNADLPDDLAAVAEAKQLLRRGETVEIWRGQKLVYRLGLGSASFETPRRSQPSPGSFGLQSPLVRSLGAFLRLKG